MDNGVHVHEIKKMSHEAAKFSSFRIKIFKHNMHLVFDEAFWPSGDKCDKWRGRSINSTNGRDATTQNEMSDDKTNGVD